MRWLHVTFLLFLVLVPAVHAEGQMDEEVDHLLATVESSDCLFIRNGKEYGPEAAKDHLSLKRRRGKRYFSTAEEFIERLASSSSWSGKPYYIRCGDEQQPASKWFNEVLANYRAGASGNSVTYYRYSQ